MLRSLLFACALAASAAGIATASGGTVKNGKIAFIRGAGSAGIELMRPDGSGRRLLVPMAAGACAAPPPPNGYCSIWSPVWSPDGRRLAYLRGQWGGTLYVIDAADGDERRLPGCGAPWPSCGDPVWSPDSSRLVVARGDSLYVVDTERTGSFKRLTRRNDYDPYYPDTQPIWSPDGKAILFNRGSLYTVRPDGFGLKRIPGTGGASSAVWFPDGRTIGFFVGGDKLFTVSLDGAAPRLLYAARSAIEGTWSPDRTRILYETERRTQSASGEGGFSAELWVMKTNGTDRHRIYSESCCIDVSPPAVWSPDGTQVAFAAAGSAVNGFFKVNADGTGPHRIVSGGIIAVREGVPQLSWQAVR